MIEKLFELFVGAALVLGIMFIIGVLISVIRWILGGIKL